MMTRFVGWLLLLTLASCARQTTLTAELSPRTLKAINLEESVSRRDELMLNYTLTSYDAQNKPVAVVSGGWGVEPVGENQQIDLQTPGPQQARPLSLPMPRNGRIVVSLVLLEVDDYNRARQLLDKVRMIHNVVSIPAALLLTTAELLTPLKYVTAGLAASGVGLNALDRLDGDDLLGQSNLDLSEADLRRTKQRLIRVPVAFSGRHLRDAYDYQLSYDVLLKAVKIRPVRQ